ncbi:MAG: translation initiation factor IF-2 [Phycisphaerae bacterium]|nr:translation initiation factor IF-2 [Phycisphaerae bacterium]
MATTTKQKRIHMLAKELGVESKVIVAKCQAEGIPGIKDHLSPVSVGLEATIREWFTATEDAPHNAVETAGKIDLEQARSSPRARAKAKTKSAKSDGEAVQTASESAVGAIAPPPPKPVEVHTPPPPTERHPPAATPTVRAEPVSTPTPTAPPASVLSPAASATAAPVTEVPAAPKIAKPHVRPPTEPPAPPSAPTGPMHGPGHGHGGRPPSSFTPRMNVPDRPKTVSPVGQKVGVLTPAKLSGPKVVRVEAPEVIEAPRPRRPMGETGLPMNRGPRGGTGVGGPGTSAVGGEDDSKNKGRNKRRGGPETATARTAPRRSAKADVGTTDWSAQDLAEREARLNRSEGFLRQRRRDQKMKDQTHKGHAASLAQVGGKVAISAPFTIKDLSAATGVKSAEVVKKLFLKGIIATPNSGIDIEQAQEIMIDYNIELEVVQAQSAEDAVIEQFASREAIDLRPRPPVVTILGHVDHGKTSLLDRIRNTKIAAGEAGGITQSTRAFRAGVTVEGEEKVITFLDTPGHEAFSEMRSRGANMTDIVVLVVSAVDGVMPQTIESIKHAQAAKVPVVVALNKIDVPGITDSQIQQIYGKLAEHNLSPVEWGGQTEVVRTSALTGLGIDTLLTTLDLQAQLLDLKADYKGAARGTVIEAKMEEGRGATAQLLVQNGELEVGDIIVAGRSHGRIRDITDDKGKRIQKAGPSTPVLISGLDVLPDAGDRFFVVDNLRKAQEASEQRQMEERQRELATPKLTLDTMFAAMKEKEISELLLVIKADVQGSVDVIKNAVEKVSTDEVKVRVLYAAAGGITESDVNLAAASGAVIMGFNVIANAKARQAAEAKRVEIRSYQVIYDIIDEVKKAAEGMLEPEIKLEVIGHAEVRQVFKVSRVGTIAGCYVTDGVIERNALIRVTRDGIVIENDRVLEQLKRFKDDAKEVKANMECGMKIVGYDDIKEGDVLECYKKTEVKRSL